jgi:uncharacterized iron-regulated membrane protein
MIARAASRAEPVHPRLYALFWRWHFLAALIVIPFVLWQSTTGTLYLWSEWWIDMRYAELRFVPHEQVRVAPSRQIAAALAAVRPAGQASASDRWPVQEIVLSEDPVRSTTVTFVSPNGLPYPVFVNPHDARVLGDLSPAEWLPGLTRALHGGWPLGRAGSWLLELGDCWAIVMILTGFYLWWPRGRSLRDTLWPRTNLGARILVRDLHACVAVLFSAVFLFFLVSALPWTAFWGGQVLSRVQSALDQESPAGFSPGGASPAQISASLSSIDQAVAAARANGVPGSLVIRLARWPQAPLWLNNKDNAPADDRIVLANPQNGSLEADFHNEHLPTIPRLVALGVHLHQGDFGPVNLWLNTAFALSLVWLAVTGITSWWIRRPRARLGVPPKTYIRWPRSLLAVAGVMCILLPIFTASLIAIAVVERLARLKTSVP